MFQITVEEAQALRFHSGILKRGQHYKYLPYAFTEQGVAMLSGVLRSHRAVQVNVAIMRAFVRLREALSLHKASLSTNNLRWSQFATSHSNQLMKRGVRRESRSSKC
jgi:hypothetical protein